MLASFCKVKKIVASRAVAAVREVRKELARIDCASFVEFVLRTEKGRRPITLTPMHREWHRMADEHDRVVIWAPNTYHWVIALLGAQYAGAAIIPINTRYTGTEALDIIERVDAAALVVVGTFLKADRYQQLLDANPDLRIPTVIQVPIDGDDDRDGVIEFEDFLALATDAARTEADARAAKVQPDDVSDILFTSGTTGRSKGAITAHRQSIAVAKSWGECAEVTADDNFLIISPFFHTFGYKAGILVCLLNGATIVPVSVFNIDDTLALVSSEKISILPGAPTIYQTILDHPRRSEYDLSSLRIAITGAAPVPVALVERMQAELFDAVLTAYGLTEAEIGRAHV